MGFKGVGSRCYEPDHSVGVIRRVSSSVCLVKTYSSGEGEGGVVRKEEKVCANRRY